MRKNKPLVVANWKMNPETAEKAREIFLETKKIAKKSKGVKLIVCPPYIYLSELAEIKDRVVTLGAQDAFFEQGGPFTGEVGPNMLKRGGEEYVIIGHSERRELGETNELIAKKILASLKSGLHTILCVGEKIRDTHGEYLMFLRNQLIESIGKIPKQYLKKLIVAYEPVWAIGKKEDEAMSPRELHETSLFIRKVLVEIYGPIFGLAIPILYGGSVSHNNAKDLLVLGEVQGLLVGRESLQPKKFSELLFVINNL